MTQLRIPRHPWWRRGAWTSLYHGTSSALLPGLRQHGLAPPTADRRQLERLIARYWPHVRVPAEAWPAIEQAVIAPRADHGGHRRGAVLYFSADFDHAAGYARAYAEHLGEIGATLRRALETYAGASCLAAAPGAEGVVLEVAVPTADLLTYQPLDALIDRITRLYETGHRLAQGFASLDALFLDCSDLEFRVAKRVPAARILSTELVGSRAGSRRTGDHPVGDRPAGDRR